MPLYTGPLDAQLLKVPRPFRMWRDEDGTGHELQEIPGNLSPRDFVGLYGKGDRLLLAYVFSVSRDLVSGGHSTFNVHEFSSPYLEAWGVGIKTREEPQYPPVVLLGEHVMNVGQEERSYVDMMIRSGLHFLDAHPYLNTTIEIFPGNGVVVPDSPGRRMRPHLSVEAQVLRQSRRNSF